MNGKEELNRKRYRSVRHFPPLKKVLIILCSVLLLIPGCSSSDRSSDFIDDESRLLTADEAKRVATMNRALLDDLDIHIQVVILKEQSPDIAAEAVERFDAVSLGRETDGAKGVLFLVDPEGRQVRLEIGYDLEGIFTDGFVGYIERNQMVPFFQSGNVGAGIEATMELLVGRALGNPDALTPPPVGGSTESSHYSGGAGAQAGIGIGTGLPGKEVSEEADRFGPQANPLASLRTYMEVLGRHIKDPDLGLYTPETRGFFRKWTVTDAQQENELQKLEKTLSLARVISNGNLAIIRFPLSDRSAAPYFLVRDEGKWMLDFASMSAHIGFNHMNQWFFRTRTHGYMFGFDDTRFDRKGFPYPRK